MAGTPKQSPLLYKATDSCNFLIYRATKQPILLPYKAICDGQLLLYKAPICTLLLPDKATPLSSHEQAMDANFQRLARRQLSQALVRFIGGPALPKPTSGWIAAIRQALDMTVRQFAVRLGVTPSNVVRLEQRERDETISLDALRRAANALNCELIYAIVPRGTATDSTNNILETMIESRARGLASEEIGRIARSMALEDQAVNGADLEAQIAERAAALAEKPRALWDLEPAPPRKKPSVRGRPRRK